MCIWRGELAFGAITASGALTGNIIKPPQAGHFACSPGVGVRSRNGFSTSGAFSPYRHSVTESKIDDDSGLTHVLI